MPRLYLDTETFSNLDLRKVGAYRYVEDPEFELLMVAYAIDDGPVEMCFHNDLGPLTDLLTDPAYVKVAHNAQFDRVVLSCVMYGATQRYLDPAQWDDTASRAAAAGHPRSLAKCAEALGTELKDSAGTRLINLFSKPDRRGQKRNPADHQAQWDEFVAYCRQDVVALRDIDRALPALPDIERRAYVLDQRINDRGIRVDMAMVAAARAAGEANGENLRQGLELFTGLERPANPAALRAVLAEDGLDLPDLTRATVAQALARPDLTTYQRAVLEMRQDYSLAAVKKYSTIEVSTSTDGRLRGQFLYHGAHTGRFSGRNVQLHNLSRDQYKEVQDEADAINRLLSGDGLPQRALKQLVRASFIGPFTVVDYSSIEARALAWLAGEQWVLDAFAAGRDIYEETAAKLSTPDNELTRQQGKQAVLALGYNGAVSSLRIMGAEGTDEELVRIVRLWRQANPSIVRFWARLEEAFAHGDRTVGRLRIVRDGSSRIVELPSGRALTYHGVKPRMVRKPGWSEPSEAITHADPHRRFPYIATYGGRLAENCTQAVARDVLVQGLLNLEAAGHYPVMHVHDEVIVPEAPVDEVSRLMCDMPPWADGMYLAAEGFICARYRKG